ncbi:MAG: aminomethyl-transferring glycine dehydrogenase [Dysgonamonadaceae bacterium]|jgi:glycine dehydrogenase|nr:aminomethyl-transferring glycine dehydrogenase [Dysgonamonadaceae bacterium]
MVQKFVDRHVGINEQEKEKMLAAIGIESIDKLISETIPENIRLKKPLSLPPAMTEREFAEHIAGIASRNEVYTSYIGQGWYDTVSPAVIIRNVLENPVWYTSYTPYQAEISQGRLEALINFQTLVCDLTAMPVANCSLLDEGTAAAEAANMLFQSRSADKISNDADILFVDNCIFDRTFAVLKTRAAGNRIKIQRGDYRELLDNANRDKIFASIVQFPNSNGSIEDYREFIARSSASDIKTAVDADLLSLSLLTPPGEWGADVVFGSSQRFGIPMYFGGPSAAYFAVKEEYKRVVPGRIIGISKDKYGKSALRMALQTREQHIKREKATSNICTAQALLATMASFYAVYHGPDGLRDIALKIHSKAKFLSEELTKLGYSQENKDFFDTIKIRIPETIQPERILLISDKHHINLHYFEDETVGISIDETTNEKDLEELYNIFAESAGIACKFNSNFNYNSFKLLKTIDGNMKRTSTFLQHPVFNSHHTETSLMRYIKCLERRDISLTHSMISLGSCTMKLNAASEMQTLSLPGFANIHPLAPVVQTEGYNYLIEKLGEYLKTITGFAGISFQPNSGAAGEYAGLTTIRSYLTDTGEGHRNIILIPASAHGTNPASAVQAGFETITVKTDASGNTDLSDLKSKAEQYSHLLAALMITYPSTHGIFETGITEICDIIHRNGGQVYMDGANMNAQVGLTNPGTIGADICHLNLHKTFAIPHGGGGPGAGPVCCAEHLIEYLPGNIKGRKVASSPYGSAGILPVTYGYIRMMGTEGLRHATEVAILSANYLAARLEGAYGIVYTGINRRVGHELILDCRNLKEQAGINETDVAKRLMDYGFHAPTLSFPVHGTLMIEPTESESLSELDRFVSAMLDIKGEIDEIASGKADASDNVLINAPHPQYEVCDDEWRHVYPRSKAAFPLDWIGENKFWINVARVDNAFGDRNLVCRLP